MQLGYELQRRLLVALGVFGAAACSLLAEPSLAQQAYPNKPVKIVVGMPAGTFTDMSARLIADKLGTALKETFVVENRPGAATNIATAGVARAPKDGYTLLLSSNSNAMNVSLFKELPFDIRKDFQPVAMIASSAFVLVVPASLPVSNLKELIAYAKAHPGVLNFASTGAGTANHLAAEMLAKQAGIKVAIVFYKGSPAAISDVLAGRAHAMFAPALTSLPHVKTAKLKALAVTSGERSPLAPDLPTMSEAGLPGYQVAMWNGLFAPAGTPPDVIKRLGDAATKAMASPEIQSKIKASGGNPVVMGPKEFDAYFQKDIQNWSDAIKAAGIQPK